MHPGPQVKPDPCVQRLTGRVIILILSFIAIEATGWFEKPTNGRHKSALRALRRASFGGRSSCESGVQTSAMVTSIPMGGTV